MYSQRRHRSEMLFVRDYSTQRVSSIYLPKFNFVLAQGD